MSLRTSFEPSEPQPPADGGVTVGPGPRTAYASPAGLGCTGRFAARFAWDAPGAHEGVLLDGPFPVTGDSRLSYCILPEDGPAGDRDATTFVSLDLVLDDGSRLSTLHPLDVHGIALTPTAQGEARILLPRQWNLVECDLPAALAGRVVLDVVYGGWPTELARWAQAGGALPLSGLGMLVHQAVEQVRLMTGRPASAQVMRAAVLAGKHSIS